MSKYNLTDILEKYKIGSGWTTDFDYDGMLKTGLGTSIDTPIEVLKKISDDFEDVNYHRENMHLSYVIDAREIPNNSGRVGHTINTGEKVIIDDVYKDPRFNAEIEKITGYKTKCMMVLPMIDNYDNIIGAFQVINH